MSDAPRPGPRLSLGLIRLYQRTLSPLMGLLLGQGCRFYPSCSDYAARVIERDGLGHGGLLALRRLARCRPGGGGGVDLP